MTVSAVLIGPIDRLSVSVGSGFGGSEGAKVGVSTSFGEEADGPDLRSSSGAAEAPGFDTVIVDSSSSYIGRCVFCSGSALSPWDEANVEAASTSGSSAGTGGTTGSGDGAGVSSFAATMGEGATEVDSRAGVGSVGSAPWVSRYVRPMIAATMNSRAAIPNLNARELRWSEPESESRGGVFSGTISSSTEISPRVSSGESTDIISNFSVVDSSLFLISALTPGGGGGLLTKFFDLRDLGGELFLKGPNVSMVLEISSSDKESLAASTSLSLIGMKEAKGLVDILFCVSLGGREGGLGVSRFFIFMSEETLGLGGGPSEMREPVGRVMYFTGV
jgi:hypothetical protein